MFKSMSPTDWAQVIGGFFIFIYIIIQVAQKLVGYSKWGRDRIKEREERKLQEAHEQYKKFTSDFVDSFVPPLMKQLTEQDDKIFNKINLLTNSSNDLLRKEMTDIYHYYLPYQKILEYDKESFIKLYNDYINQGGNSYIQQIYSELITWKVVSKIEDLHY